jgi:hypothetical protein
MSTSDMKVPDSTILIWVVVFGRQNHRAHGAALSPERVRLNTISISSSPFITAKKRVKAETNPASAYHLNRIVSSFSFIILFRTGFASSLCGRRYSGTTSLSNHNGVPSRMEFLNSPGQRQNNGVNPPSQIHHLMSDTRRMLSVLMV